MARPDHQVLDQPALRPAVGLAARAAVEELARSGAAVARLTVLEADRRLDEHVHDNPYLSLHVLGSYREQGDGGEAAIDGPAAAFHPAGSAHADAIGTRGLATIVIELDPAWARRALGPANPDRSRYWIGGEMGRQASRLARAWLGRGGQDQRFAATWAFLRAAAHDSAEARSPAWVGRLGSEPVRTAAFAQALGVSPAWVARAYRESRGEGLRETWRRLRVEAAVRLLEAGDTPLAQVACEAGFCDQSHMNRAFQALLGRTPAAVRATGLVRAGLA